MIASTYEDTVIIIMDDLLVNFKLSPLCTDKLQCHYAITVRVYQVEINSDEGKICF
jgi:hypothetical protein